MNARAASLDGTPVPPTPVEGVGPVEDSVRTYAASMRLAAGDLRVPMLVAAQALARLLDAGQQPAGVARELGRFLRWAADGEHGDGLDEIRAGMAQRRAEELAWAALTEAARQ